MRSPLSLTPDPLAAARSHANTNRGQPLVLAFAEELRLRESPTLEQIRSELRGLGAALLLVTQTGVFCFRPDDELDIQGTNSDVDPRTVDSLRTACGLPPSLTHELSLVLVVGDGHVVARHSFPAPDELAALARALSVAGREALAAQPFILSRREIVLASLLGAFALLAADGCRGTPPQHAAPAAAVSTTHTRPVTLNINGAAHQLQLEPRVSLLDALRERLGLTGSKKGCDHGQCGACTVLVGGRRVNACLTLAVMVGDAPIITIEGLAQGEQLHPMQAAFAEEDALQCGYCTPGQIMSALGLVRENRAHTDDEVREHMSGNICRCGAYPNIVRAIQRARAASAPG